MGFLDKIHGILDPVGHKIVKPIKKKVEGELGFDPEDPFQWEQKIHDKISKGLGWDFDQYNFRNIGKDIWKNPMRILAPSPISTKVWNEVTGRDDDPLVNQLGGPASSRYKKYIEDGGDPSAAKKAAGAHAVAAAIASWYAGGALAAVAAPGAAAASAAASTAATAGATAGAAGAGAITVGGLSISAGQAAMLARAGVSAGAALADEEFDPIEGEDEIDLDIRYSPAPRMQVGNVGNVGGFKEGGYASPAQARLMRATAHGWKKPGGGGPSRAVANEFVDKKDRGYQEGGEVNYETAPGEYSPRTAEDVGPALEQMFRNMEDKDDARIKDVSDYAWGKSKSREATTTMDAEFEGMTGPQMVEFVKPRLVEAMALMKEIGESPTFKQYSMRDYINAQSQVNLWRGKWSQALQKQARESGMPTEEEITRIGVDDGGESIFMNQEEAQGFAGGGSVEGMTFKQLYKKLDNGIAGAIQIARGLEDGTYTQDPNDDLIYMREPTMVDTVDAPPAIVSQGPRGGGPGGGGRGNRGGGGRGGRGGGRGGGGGNPPPVDDEGEPCPPGMVRGRLGNCRAIRPGDLPRVIPGGVDPIGGGTAGPYNPPPSPGRESSYSQELSEHDARIKAIFGGSQGGSVGYAEGGDVEARPGHAEGANPYPVDSARYKQWERYNHKDPAVAPPPEAVEEEPPSWLERIFAPAKDLGTRTERELEEMEEAQGGYIQNYATGGLAAMNPGGPMGMRGPQRMQPGKPMPPRIPPPQGMPPRGGMPGRGMPPGRMMPPRGGRGRGMPPRGMAPPNKGPMPQYGGDVPMMTGRGEPPQIEGGPRMPPNLQGHMQTMKMQNRPRRGFSGPAGAGGPPGNRVGQGDQQGGLARALQRGTGRPPISRRSGFPGR